MLLEKLLSEETIKRLLISIKSPKAWRSMDPIEVAQNLKFLCERMPREEVARRFNISKRATLWVYLRLLDLPEKVQELIRAGKIGKDKGYRISLLKDKREQEILADAAIKHHLSSGEVRGIVQSLKKRNPDMPIEECIQLALKARPIIEEEHVIVTKIQKDTLKTLKEKSEECGVVMEELVRKVMEKEVIPPNSITSLRFIDTTVILSLGKDCFKAFKDKARETKVKPEDLVETLIKKWLQNEN